MSKAPKEKDLEAGVAAALQERVGTTVFVEPFGDPAFLPPADIYESASCLSIRVELPGVRRNEVAVFVQGATIEVVGEKMRDACGSEVSFLCLERTSGKFGRTFELTGCLNMGQVDAVLTDGVLVLRVPKCQERRGRRRRVPVTTEEK